MWSTILLLSVSQIALGLCVPLWLDMIARIIPLELRGRYFGCTTAAFAVGGILGGSALAALEQRLGPAVYPATFAAAVFSALSIATFALTPIPAEVFVHERVASIWNRCRRTLGACGPSTDFGRMVWSHAGVILAAAIIPYTRPPPTTRDTC